MINEQTVKIPASAQISRKTLCACRADVRSKRPIPTPLIGWFLMKEISITGEAILDFLRMSVSCCMLLLAGIEPPENKVKLFEIAEKDPTRIFVLSELMQQLPLVAKSVFDKDLERIAAATKSEVNFENILGRCDVLNFFAKDHITFIASRAKEESIPLVNHLGKDYLLGHTLCPCIISKTEQGTFNARFADPDRKNEFRREVMGLVNLTGETVKPLDTVLVHFAAVIAHTSICPEFADFQKLVLTQNNLSNGKVIEALKRKTPINYRNFDGIDVTSMTQKRAIPFKANFS